MKHFLRKAFADACALPAKIHEIYDFAGFTLFRALTDDTFLAASPAAVDSRALRFGIECYDSARDKAQSSLCNLVDKCARGEIAVRPTLKVAARAFNIATVLAMRVNWGSPGAVAMAGLAVAAAGYLYLHGGGHGVSDTIASLYGTAHRPKPQ